MTIREKIIVIIFGVIATGFFSYAIFVNFYSSQLDSAMMVENIESIPSFGRPKSQINASALKALDTVIIQTANEVCIQDLVEKGVDSIEMFRRHAYGILYLLAPFNLLIPAQYIASFFHALTFIGVLIAVYSYLRNERIHVAPSLFFVLMVTVYPSWSLSVFGQFYPDRFFIFFGTVYLFLLWRKLEKKNTNLASIFIVALIAASINERAAIMVGFSTIWLIFSFQGWRSWTKGNVSFALLALGILAYSVLYMKLFQVNSDYGSFLSQAWSFLEVIGGDNKLQLELKKFLLVNLPYIILALFNWRTGILAIGAMLPNIFGSIGGAEKTGWSTHYHAMYFPFLIFAASLGFVKISQKSNTVYSRTALGTGMILVVFYELIINPYDLNKFNGDVIANLQNNAFVRVSDIFLMRGDGLALHKSSKLRKDIASLVPPSSSISTFEGMMPALYGAGRTLYYYPLGIGSSDFVIVEYTLNDKQLPIFFGAYSYLGVKNKDQLNECLNLKITQNYDLLTLNSGFAIFKRKKAR